MSFNIGAGGRRGGTGLSRTRRQRKETRPPAPSSLARFPALPRGPSLYQRAANPLRLSGPGKPPPMFLTHTNSRSEWWVYWALAKLFDDPVDPRRPPYLGGHGWTYQTTFEGGRGIAGGALVDFVVHAGSGRSREDIGIRVQTERWHVFADARKQAYDEMQARTLGRFIRIADIYEQDFLDDERGETVCRLLADILSGADQLNPLRGMTGLRVRQ